MTPCCTGASTTAAPTYWVASDGDEDEDCLVVGTFSGAMTVGMMGHLLCDMLEAGFLQAVISTGALMAHGFVQAAGLTHYKWDPRMDDEELYKKRDAHLKTV